MPDLPLDIQEAAAFPTDWDLQAAVAKMKRGKAPGPNGITPCLLKAGGSTFSKHFAALTTKVVAHGKRTLILEGEANWCHFIKGVTPQRTQPPTEPSTSLIAHPSSTTECCAVNWKGLGQQAWTCCK